MIKLNNFYFYFNDIVRVSNYCLGSQFEFEYYIMGEPMGVGGYAYEYELKEISPVLKELYDIQA